MVFFDECESLFESRDSGRNRVASLLTEIERFEGILILATNRPHDMDEAMHRRIALAIEFPPPVLYSAFACHGGPRGSLAHNLCRRSHSMPLLAVTTHTKLEQDLHLREKIWRAHVPNELKVSPDIDWRVVAADYELAGTCVSSPTL